MQNDKRLIDANALKKPIVDWLEWYTASVAVKSAVQEFVEILDEFPTIDAVEVVHARWVHEQRYGDSGGWVWRCSACRREAISPIISALKYCHSCGAKMDAKEG